MPVNIRPFEARHVDAVAQIEQESFRDPWSRAAYEEELKNPLAHYVIAEADGQVVGYAGFWHIMDEGHITNVAVKSTFRGQGIGESLMRALMEETKKEQIEAVTLEVRVSNAPAIRLYEKMGFVGVGVRPGYYPDGEGAVIMWHKEAL